MDFSPKTRLLNSQIARTPTGADVTPEHMKERKPHVPVHSISVLRFDPYQRTVERVSIEMTTEDASGAAEIAKMCSTNLLGSTKLDLNLFGIPLYACGGANHLEDVPAWQLRGAPKSVAGIGLLFVLGPNGGMANLPVTASMGWARDNVTWIEGEKN